MNILNSALNGRKLMKSCDDIKVDFVKNSGDCSESHYENRSKQNINIDSYATFNSMEMLEKIMPSDHNILHNFFPKFDGINFSDLHMLFMLNIDRPLREGSHVSSRVM